MCSMTKRNSPVCGFRCRCFVKFIRSRPHTGRYFHLQHSSRTYLSIVKACAEASTIRNPDLLDEDDADEGGEEEVARCVSFSANKVDP